MSDGNRTVFLLVGGSSGAATNFKDNHDPQKFYENMVEQGVTYSEIETCNNGVIETITVKIMEFGSIDKEYIRFMLDVCCDEYGDDVDLIQVMQQEEKGNIKVKFCVTKRFEGDEAVYITDFPIGTDRQLIDECFEDWLFDKIDAGWHMIKDDQGRDNDG